MKLKATYETEIYVSDGGYVAIKQEDPMGDDPAIVILAPSQLPAVIAELQRLLATSDDWWDPVEEGGNAD